MQIILIFFAYILGGQRTNFVVAKELAKREIWPKGEAELYKRLFQNYSSLIRPVKNANESVVITFELFIAQLIKVDEVC